MDNTHRIVSLQTCLFAKVMTTTDRIENLLREGCEFYQFEYGIVSKIVADDYCILSAVADIPFFKPGDCFELKDTFCRAIIDTGKTVCYNEVGEVGELQEHRAYRQMHLESYIGAPVSIDGQVVGTVNFSSLVARERKFSVEEVQYIEDLAKTLARDFEEVFAN